MLKFGDSYQICTYLKSINKVIEVETVVWVHICIIQVTAGNGVRMMDLPKLLILQHNLFQVFKCYDDWIYLADLAQLEEFNS
jgi:hypothetical protein